MIPSEQCLSWQTLQPELYLSQDLAEQQLTFFDLQPRAVAAVSQFLQNSHRTLLVLKADDLAECAAAVEHFIKAKKEKLALSGVNYVIEQADSFSFAQIRVEPAQAITDNFAAKQTVASALYFDRERLLGSIRIHPCSKDIQLNAGLVHQLNNGILILSVSAFLSQFDLWEQLKQILTTKVFHWYSAHPFKPLPCEIPACPLSLKVILLGSRTELATLAELEPELYTLADYSEIENYFSVENGENQIRWAQYVQAFARQNGFPTVSIDGLTKLYQWLVRESEDRSLINISPLTLHAILSGAGLFSNTNHLTAVDFENFFRQKIEQQSFLREQTYADILHEQVYVETEGEAVGQINGLSVIEYAGTPLSFGEPSRISCIIQFGDGEVIDIERKNELAGSVHSKGIMIAQACLANILELPSQLPFSASLVFEQSYGEIDGDSASLAAFCVLTSALSDLPLPQSIAITGAIDQFGLVHAVGGVNDKIEGFFAICQRRELTGKQGVIIPRAAIHQLCLTEDVVSAVKNQQFFIWAVDDVFQACEILFQRPFVEEEQGQDRDETEKKSLSRLISRRIEYRSGAHQQPFNLWATLFGKKYTG